MKFRNINSLRMRLIEIGVVSVIYYGAGKIGQLMVIQPGIASAVWPPAGIALAVILLRGYRVLPGIFLGAFFGFF